MIRASCIIWYLGCGLATQYIGYGDMTFRTLASPDATISTWAHILAWPFFVFLLCGYYLLWGLVFAIGFGGLLVGYLAVDDWRSKRKRRWARELRQNGNVRTST